ncbi:hypothetical protein ABZ403_14025 [Micromonospora zamorensis]|uniref:hypothetical protein n=1 Tax=Micromonospora zamorensis TaxID=709883 RepID=UPI0034042A39
MPDSTNREIAQAWMNSAAEDRETENLEAARDTVQEAQVYALLSVADELRALREAINGVEDALEDQSGHGVGTHARHISDWLERISKK